MNRLVSYAATSSDDDEDNCSSFSQEYGCAVLEGTFCRRNENVDTRLSANKVVDTFRSDNKGEIHKVAARQAPVPDLPITDESDDQIGSIVNSDSEHCSELCSTKVNSISHQLKSAAVQQQDCSRNESQTITGVGDDEDKETAHLAPTWQQTHTYHQTTNSGDLQLEISDISVLRDESKLPNGVDIDSTLSPYSEGNKSFTISSLESHSLIQPVVSEPASCTLPKRKRKLSDGSQKHLDIPDSIQSMFLNKQQRWTDDPAQHDNRVRSFPHLEGNWATHVYIPVVKTDQFVKFVEELLAMLMPPTFQAQPDFHVSLSRTVTIRYHWIELLVDSLREQFKSLTSCISDFTSVKLCTNDEKTRTFVVIELSPEDNREFKDYVRAVDKSFAEFKLPAYYENPSFHISVGWCLGDVTGDIPGEKLSKAQEMLGDFLAANSDLSFVYVHQICCQIGCKSFVITLPDSDS
ncbi:hypothetical protein BsWGS_22205 [Bradybaena similaris]